MAMASRGCNRRLLLLLLLPLLSLLLSLLPSGDCSLLAPFPQGLRKGDEGSDVALLQVRIGKWKCKSIYMYMEREREVELERRHDSWCARFPWCRRFSLSAQALLKRRSASASLAQSGVLDTETSGAIGHLQRDYNLTTTGEVRSKPGQPHACGVFVLLLLLLLLLLLVLLLLLSLLFPPSFSCM